MSESHGTIRASDRAVEHTQNSPVELGASPHPDELPPAVPMVSTDAAARRCENIKNDETAMEQKNVDTVHEDQERIVNRSGTGNSEQLPTEAQTDPLHYMCEPTFAYWALVLEPVNEGTYKRVGLAMLYLHAFEDLGTTLQQFQIL
jgi:hypothetical protein